MSKLTQAVGTACIPRGPAVEMPVYEFLCHELSDEQFLFLSSWKAGKFRVDFSFQPSYTVGTAHYFWGGHSRHVSTSAGLRYWHPGEYNEGSRTELKRNFFLGCTSFFSRSGEKKLVTPCFPLPGEESLLPCIFCFGLKGGTTHLIRL